MEDSSKYSSIGPKRHGPMVFKEDPRSEQAFLATFGMAIDPDEEEE
jgi:hypothetical protein